MDDQYFNPGDSIVAEFRVLVPQGVPAGELPTGEVWVVAQAG